MALCYNVLVVEVVSVTSSLSSSVLGTAKHVVLTMIAALFIDHILVGAAPAELAITISGLVLYVPCTAAYAYLMLTHQALEPWSHWDLREATWWPWWLACTTRRRDAPNMPKNEKSALLLPGAKGAST